MDQIILPFDKIVMPMAIGPYRRGNNVMKHYVLWTELEYGSKYGGQWSFEVILSLNSFSFFSYIHEVMVTIVSVNAVV